MNTTMQATGAEGTRQRHAAALGIAVAHINAFPEDGAYVREAFERVLEIAASSPGGWGGLIDGLVASKSRIEVLSFCKAFTSTLLVAANAELIPQPVHDMEG